MSHPNKHIDDLQARLNQARLVQQRNNNHASSFSFPRFVASLRAALKGIRKQDKQDPKELVCEFADAIPGFNDMLKKMKPEQVRHLGSDLFEVVLSGGHQKIPLLDPVRQIMSIRGKVLLENYESVHRACAGSKDDMYFSLRRTDDFDVVELIGYDAEGACLHTLVAAAEGYSNFLVMSDHNSITAYKKNFKSELNLYLDTLEPIPKKKKEPADEDASGSDNSAFAARYNRSYFGIPGKHVLKERKSDGKEAMFGIDPQSKKTRRITDRHWRILDNLHRNGNHIYAFDEHKNGALDLYVYDLKGRLLHKKQYTSKPPSLLDACKPLPLGFHVELNDGEQGNCVKAKQIICNSKGEKIEGLEFNNISESGLGTTQCIRMPRKAGRIQFGLYSLEKQYWIIPPTMLSEITFVSGVAVLHSSDGTRVVKAKDILECENKGIAYQ